MARIPQVTRTITTTHAKVLCLDLSTKKPITKEVIIPRTYKDEAAALKVIKPMLESDELKVVHVVDTQTVDTLYGMTESDFIIHAHVIPPRKAE